MSEVKFFSNQFHNLSKSTGLTDKLINKENLDLNKATHPWACLFTILFKAIAIFL